MYCFFGCFYGNKEDFMKRFFALVAVLGILGFAFVGCDDKTPDPIPIKVEKTYLAPNTKVTIKYMGFASATGIPAEVSKLAGIFTASSSTYLVRDRTIYVIDGGAAACSIRANGTMEAGSKWIIDTPTDDVDDAIYDLRASWLAVIKWQILGCQAPVKA
jgi:hypothetical protein